MHFIKAVVLGMSIAAANAAALPAEDSEAVGCNFTGGIEACQTHVGTTLNR